LNVALTDNFPPLRLRQKASYTVGDIADGIESTAVSTFLLFYLTVAVGLPGTLAGLALGIAMTVDAILNPLIGYLSDHTRSRWGRRHPWVIGGIAPLALSLGLMFSIPTIESTTLLFCYALVAATLVRVSFSVFVVPYAALAPELSRDYAERSALMAWRNFFNICGALVCIGLGFGWFLAGDRLTDRAAYVPFGWMCAAILLVSGLWSGLSSLRMRDRLYPAPPAGRSAWAHLPSDVRNLFASGSFRILFFNVLFFWIGLSIAENLTVHALRFFWALPEDMIRNLMVLKLAGLAVGIPLSAVVSARFEKRDIAIAASALLALAHFLPALFALLGWMPGPGGVLQALLGFIYLLIGTQYTTLAISYFAMMADGTDEHDLHFAQRSEGLYMSSLTFASKCALGFGAFAAGGALDLIGFPAGLAGAPDESITDSTRIALGIIYGPVAAVVMLAATAVLRYYRIGRQQHASIRAQLANRGSAER